MLEKKSSLLFRLFDIFSESQYLLFQCLPIRISCSDWSSGLHQQTALPSKLVSRSDWKEVFGITWSVRYRHQECMYHSPGKLWFPVEICSDGTRMTKRGGDHLRLLGLPLFRPWKCDTISSEDMWHEYIHYWCVISKVLANSLNGILSQFQFIPYFQKQLCT